MNIFRILAGIVMMSLLLPANGRAADSPHLGTYTPDRFRDYGYNRGAEMSRFSLQQVHYGEIHAGDALLVFVTETFNPTNRSRWIIPARRTCPRMRSGTWFELLPRPLPQGAFLMMLGPVYVRLVHCPLASQKAVAVLAVTEDKSLEGNALLRYTIDFPGEQRTRHIYLEMEFPCRIPK
jgi:hypothetical protein